MHLVDHAISSSGQMDLEFEHSIMTRSAPIILLCESFSADRHGFTKADCMSELTHEELSTLIEEHKRDLQHFSRVAWDVRRPPKIRFKIPSCACFSHRLDRRFSIRGHFSSGSPRISSSTITAVNGIRARCPMPMCRWTFPTLRLRRNCGVVETKDCLAQTKHRRASAQIPASLHTYSRARDGVNLSASYVFPDRTSVTKNDRQSAPPLLQGAGQRCGSRVVCPRSAPYVSRLDSARCYPLTPLCTGWQR